jgi:hypothetical protein
MNEQACKMIAGFEVTTQGRGVLPVEAERRGLAGRTREQRLGAESNPDNESEVDTWFTEVPAEVVSEEWFIKGGISET